MAAIAAVVGAILRSTWRDLRSLGSFAGNNLVAVIFFLMWEEPVNRPSSTAPFYLLIGVLYLLPLAQEISERIPAVRSRLWPLSGMQRIAVYAVNLAMNPLFIIAFLFAALSREPVIGVALFVSGAIAPVAVYAINAIAQKYRSISGRAVLRFIPRFPGTLGGLIQNHLREFFHLLDLYFAAAIAAGGFVYLNLSAHANASAPIVLAHLTVIFLSTLAQTQFGFDVRAARERLRLMPVLGIHILLAKDIAWFVLLLLLVWPFPLLPAIGAGLAALAVGHHTSITRPIEQRRWRFAQGHLAPSGVVQIIALLAAGSVIHQFGLVALLLPAASYVISLWWYGRVWDRSSVAGGNVPVASELVS